MPRHDYDLPHDYEQRVAEGTMTEWYTQERAKRQALRQATNFERKTETLRRRVKRRLKAAAETVPVRR